MSTVITRFAPSPTGLLHIGNARTALINWLYAKKHGGKFILRIDDTDVERSNKAYENAIINDLEWLGISWDMSFRQSGRLDKYNLAKEELLASGRLYPCYETASELEFKRKLQLASGKPPIYDRAALKLTEQQKRLFLREQRKPHYRFLIEDKPIVWHDMVKGEIKYHGKDLGDPIVIREDGSFTYMLCSCIDDIDYGVTDIIRGEDHVTNTAIQLQMLEAFAAKPLKFGHLSLVKGKEEKISKRVGGFEISYFRDEEDIEALTLVNFFTFIGSAKSIHPYTNYQNIIDQFDITAYSKSPTTYMADELFRLNHKLLLNMDFKDIQLKLSELNFNNKIDESFWLAVRPNLNRFKEILIWYKICNEHQIITDSRINSLITKAALESLPQENINNDSWKTWTKQISMLTNKQGKELFLSLRLALTGMDYGPDLGAILPLIGYNEIIKRLKSYL